MGVKRGLQGQDAELDLIITKYYSLKLNDPICMKTTTSWDNLCDKLLVRGCTTITTFDWFK